MSEYILHNSEDIFSSVLKSSAVSKHCSRNCLWFFLYSFMLVNHALYYLQHNLLDRINVLDISLTTWDGDFSFEQFCMLKPFVFFSVDFIGLLETACLLENTFVCSHLACLSIWSLSSGKYVTFCHSVLYVFCMFY